MQNFLECFLVASGKPANLCVMSKTCGQVLAMEHDGSVYACDHFVDPATASETVRQRRFGISGRLAGAGRLRSGEAHETCPPAVGSARCVRFCNGGCPKDRFTAASDGEPGLNYLCSGYRRFYSHVRPYLQRMAALARHGRPISAISAELELAEHEERARWRATGRNEPVRAEAAGSTSTAAFTRRR